MTMMVADGSLVVATQVGVVELSVRAINGVVSRVRVSRVYYNDKFKANLFSWGVLRKSGWEMSSSSVGTRVLIPSSSSAAAIAVSLREDRGVFVLEDVSRVGNASAIGARASLGSSGHYAERVFAAWSVFSGEPVRPRSGRIRIAVRLRGSVE